MHGESIQAVGQTIFNTGSFQTYHKIKLYIFLPYLIVLTEMQYFHIRFHIALPSPFMTFSEVFAKWKRFQVTQGTSKFSSTRLSPRFMQQPSTDSRFPSDSSDLHSNELREASFLIWGLGLLLSSWFTRLVVYIICKPEEIIRGCSESYI